MFDIGFLEMVVLAVVALLVLGPEKLPGAVRMAGLYLGRIKRSLAEVRSQVERELGADELRQTLHNEKIMAELAKKPGSSNVRRRNHDDGHQEPAAGTSDAEPPATPEADGSDPAAPTRSNDEPTPRT